MSEFIPKSKEVLPSLFARYWKCYGGWKAILSSRYFIISGFVTAGFYPMWAIPEWWDSVINIVPNLLGFSLGGYAMLLSFGNEGFVKLLTKESEERLGARPVPYMGVSSAFVHFILMQSLALALALLCKCWYIPVNPLVSHCLNLLHVKVSIFILLTHIVWPVGFFSFVYAIACSLAATMRIFQLTQWFNWYLQAQAKRAKTGKDTPEPPQD